MKDCIKNIRIAILATLLLTGLIGGLYPLLVWGVAQSLFPRQANGSLIVKDGKVLGSALIAQPFASPGYFHPRPSAAGKGYDAASSGGSNLGPLAQKQWDAVRQRVKDYREINGLGLDAMVPVDAVTASGSGLDPHISPANAHLQAARVAKARGMAKERVLALITAHIAAPTFGILGEPRVNVMSLNMALDDVAATVGH